MSLQLDESQVLPHLRNFYIEYEQFAAERNAQRFIVQLDREVFKVARYKQAAERTIHEQSKGLSAAVRNSAANGDALEEYAEEASAVLRRLGELLHFVKTNLN